MDQRRNLARRAARRFGNRASARRLPRVTIATLSIVVGLSTGARSATAQTATTSGSFSLAGTVRVGSYPCAIGCGGSINAYASGAVSGVGINGLPFVAEWDLGQFSGSFIDQEDCPALLPVPALTGRAIGGVFSIQGGHFLAGGSGDPATLSGGFSWVRAGTEVVISVQATSLSGSGGQIAFGGLGAGMAPGTLVPVPSFNLGNPVPPNCATRGDLLAAIQATDVQVD